MRFFQRFLTEKTGMWIGLAGTLALLSVVLLDLKWPNPAFSWVVGIGIFLVFLGFGILIFARLKDIVGMVRARNYAGAFGAFFFLVLMLYVSFVLKH